MENETSLLVVIYGCLGRSLHLTNQNHLSKIFKIFDKTRIHYQTCYVDNSVNGIDGVVADVSYTKLKSVSNADFRITMTQQEIDNKIFSVYPNYLDETWGIRYSKSGSLNPYRNSYIETIVSEFIGTHEKKFTHSLVFNSDLWFDKKFNLNWIDSDYLFVSDTNPAKTGYTNGFYFGKIVDVKNLLNLFYNLDILATKDYEYAIKKNSQIYSLPIKQINYRFLKIRANGKPAYNCRRNGRIWSRIRHIYTDFKKHCKIDNI